MFSETYGFSAHFKVEFCCKEVRYENPLIQVAIKAVEDAFAELGWSCLSSVDKKCVNGAAEPVKESKVDEFFRTKVNPWLTPGTLSTMRLFPDRICWDFVEAETTVTAKVEFYIRKTTKFFNRPEQERLSSIIRRLFERVLYHSNKYSLGVSIHRDRKS